MINATIVTLICLVSGVAPVLIIARRLAPERTFLVSIGRPVDETDRAWEIGVRFFSLASAVVVFVGMMVVDDQYAPVLLMTATLAPMLALGAGTLRAVLTSEVSAPAGRFTVPLDEPFKARALASPFWQTANVALIVGAASVFWWLLPKLPPEIPIKLDLYGRPTAWGPPTTLWINGAMMVFTTATMWAAFFGLAQERVALTITAPKAHLQLHRARRLLLARSLEMILVASNLVLAVAWIGTSAAGMLGSSPRPTWLMIGLFGLIALTIMGPLAYFIPRLIRVQEALRRQAGSDVLGTHASGWRLGGFFYYAPDDPALFVPKKIGIGQTLNMARPASWILLGALVATPLLLTWGFVGR